MSAASSRPLPRLEREPPPAGAPPPEETSLPAVQGLAAGRLAALRVAVVGLFVLALLGALYVARVVVLPIVLALLFSLILAPVVRGLRRLRLPRWIASAIVVSAVVAGGGGLLYYLATPAAEWMDQAPTSLSKLETELRELMAPVEKMSRATERVERMADVGGTREREVQVASESLSASLMNITLAVVSAAAVMLVLLYFLLTSGDVMVRKVAGVVRSPDGKHRVVEIARTLEESISTYLLTIALINVCLGIGVGTALWLLDMPNPVLWGTMACLLNFVPYLGAMVGVAVVAMVSLLTFDGLAQAALPPLVYLALTSLEGSFITPTILGQRLTLNPLVIFVGIIFWGWMWGVVGALVAVPMLASFKIVCDHVERLKPVGDLLGR
jgi:predicted PurR-regulated permease PerM